MNILLPTDGSRYAVAAARFVARYGRIADARVEAIIRPSPHGFA
jgi:hypothetical protein